MIESFPRAGRRARLLSAENLTEIDYLAGGQKLPLVIGPSVRDVNPPEWAANSASWINRQLLEHGGILFRDFELDSQGAFAKFMRALTPTLMDYADQHTPRLDLGEQVYTSTEYPADQRIELHSEMSYSHIWPRKIWFFCVTPALEGGETPLADNRKVLSLLDPQLIRRFEKDGVMYVRNYGDGLGLSWQTAFRTSNKSEVERYFHNASVTFEWKTEDRLRTRYIGPAVVKHPETGEKLWFNQAHAFHRSSLAPETQAALLNTFREEDLPNNAYYGDGSSIEDSDLEQIRRAYMQASVSFPWRHRDVLMLDNMLVAHGRQPFKGQRKVLAAMAEPYSGPVAACEPAITDGTHPHPSA